MNKRIEGTGDVLNEIHHSAAKSRSGLRQLYFRLMQTFGNGRMLGGGTRVIREKSRGTSAERKYRAKRKVRNRMAAMSRRANRS